MIYVDPSGHLFGIDDALIFAVVGGALFGGTVAEVSGGDFLEGALMGAISGALFYGAGELIMGLNGIAEANAVVAADLMATGTPAQISSLAQSGIHAGAGALSGGINSGIMGGDIGMGMLTGGIAGGVSMYAGMKFGLNDMSNPTQFAKSFAGRMAVGGVTGGIASELYGGNFGEGFRSGASTTAYGFIFNCFWHNTIEKIRKEGRVRAGGYINGKKVYYEMKDIGWMESEAANTHKWIKRSEDFNEAFLTVAFTVAEEFVKNGYSYALPVVKAANLIFTASTVHAPESPPQ